MWRAEPTTPFELDPVEFMLGVRPTGLLEHPFFVPLSLFKRQQDTWTNLEDM